jgi:5-phospho-D-xylono-1,4-lactonase
MARCSVVRSRNEAIDERAICNERNSAMRIIRTVRGDIQPDQLGVTYPHEHVLTNPPPTANDPDLRMDSIPLAIAEVQHFRSAGGHAIVDMAPADYGRDPAGLRAVSEATGVHILSTTGWLKDKTARAFVADRSVDDLAAEMIRDVQEGIGTSGVRAGLIKAGSSLNTITPIEEKIFRAAAQAQRATGAPISTHTEHGTMAIEQVTLLRSAGVPADRIILGHLDHKLDEDYHQAVLATGVTIMYDQISKEKYASDAQRIAFIKRRIAAGQIDQLMLSGDLARASNRTSYGRWNGPGLTYILWRFIPWLVSEGVTREQVEQLVIQNPARCLSFEP